MESRTMVDDRAIVVARAILAILTAPELRQRIEDMLREEFDDERRQAVADRTLADD
jgi:hypothetical protein